MGLVGASEACRGFEGEVGGGAVVDFVLRDFDSGPPRELGHRLDLRGPALRLPADVDIFFLAELLFAEFGRTMELGRSGADADVGFRRFGAAADSTPVERSGSYGVIDNDRQILQQLRWGARLRSRRAAPGAALNDQQNLAALTWFAALTRARARGWAARCHL